MPFLRGVTSLTLFTFLGSISLTTLVFATVGDADSLSSKSDFTVVTFSATAHAKRHRRPLLSPAPLLAPSLQTLRVQVPSPATSTCDQDAQDMAHRFEGATQIKTVAAHCDGRDSIRANERGYFVDSITLSYMSPTKAKGYSAVFGYSDDDSMPYNSTGVYATYQSCLDDVATQTQTFETQTALKVVAASCSETPLGLPTLYSMKLESFGKPLKKLYVYAPSYQYSAEQELLSWAKEYLGQQSIAIVGETNRSLFYYASRAISFGHGDLISFGYMKTCEAQLAQARAIMNSAHLPALVRCLPTTGDPDMGGATVLAAVWVGHVTFTHQSAFENTHYYSVDECAADKPRAVTQEKRDGRYVLGAFCREGETQTQSYVMDILEQL